MKETYLTYQRFDDAQSAAALGDFLQAHQVDFEIEDASAGGLNDAILGMLATKDYRLKLKQADFRKADELLQAYYSDAINHLPSDYYLYQFSDLELKEIIAKRDEWGVLDFVLAKQLLQQRGIAITEESIAVLAQQRIDQLAKPERSGSTWVRIGYALLVLMSIIGLAQLKGLISAWGGVLDAIIVLGILGVFTGYSLTMKKTLPNGERVFAYDAPTQRHGKKILILSIILLLAWSICKFYIVFGK